MTRFIPSAMKGVVFVTGAGSGIGKSIAHMLVMKGYEVFGAARNKKKDWPEGVHFLQVDVTDENAVKDALQYVHHIHTQLFAVVNCAGLGMLGAIEDSSSDEIRALFETNLMGVHHVCRYAIPWLRASGGGYIVNITSMAAQMGLPYRGIYCASKFAVEGYTEALSMETSADGIRVVLIEPGDVRTAINSHRKIVSVVSKRHESIHQSIHRQVNDEVDHGLHPDTVAKVVASILEDPRPALRYRIGRRKSKLAYYLMRLLPDRWFEAIIKKHYKIQK